jgi:hypothetical protein
MGPTDDNEGVCILRLCPSPALQAGVVVLVMILLSVIGATSRHRRLAVAPRSSLACGMVNRSPCLESHGDQATQLLAVLNSNF